MDEDFTTDEQVVNEQPEQVNIRSVTPEDKAQDVAEDVGFEDKVIDDMGKVGGAFSDMLMRVDEMEMSIDEGDDDQSFGGKEVDKPISIEQHGFEVVPENDDPALWAFGLTVKGADVTVQLGPIYIQGYQRIDFAGATNTATGAYCWPTIQIPISNPAGASLQMLASLPDPDSTNVYIPLVRLKNLSYPAETSYAYDGAGSVLHRGAIHLSNPLVYG